MDLSQICLGMRARVEQMSPSPITDRLRQFGLVEGTAVFCRLARRRIVALEWGGTVVALRRKDIVGLRVRVMA